MCFSSYPRPSPTEATILPTQLWHIYATIKLHPAPPSCVKPADPTPQEQKFGEIRQCREQQKHFEKVPIHKVAGAGAVQGRHVFSIISIILVFLRPFLSIWTPSPQKSCFQRSTKSGPPRTSPTAKAARWTTTPLIKDENENENENITRKASWHRTYPIPRVQHYSAAASACSFGTAGDTIQGPCPDPHTQVGSWQRHLMTGAAKRVPSLRLRRAAARPRVVSRPRTPKSAPLVRIIATPSSRRIKSSAGQPLSFWGCVLSRRASRCRLRAILQSPTRTAPAQIVATSGCY